MVQFDEVRGKIKDKGAIQWNKSRLAEGRKDFLSEVRKRKLRVRVRNVDGVGSTVSHR